MAEAGIEVKKEVLESVDIENRCGSVTLITCLYKLHLHGYFVTFECLAGLVYNMRLGRFTMLTEPFILSNELLQYSYTSDNVSDMSIRIFITKSLLAK